MNDFRVDFASILNKNTSLRLSLADKRKGPLKPEQILISKDDKGFTSYYMDKPNSIDVGGKKIPNVYQYTTMNFSDASTDKGRVYSIRTPESDISAYMKDGKFAMLAETYDGTKSINVGNHSLKGHISKEVYADGSQKYNAITKNYRVKSIKVSPDGIIIGPQKSLAEKLGMAIAKKVKLLKF